MIHLTRQDAQAVLESGTGQEYRREKSGVARDVRDTYIERLESILQAAIEAGEWELSESDLLTLAVEAGFLPNTIHSWMPALKRYTGAVLAERGAE